MSSRFAQKLNVTTKDCDNYNDLMDISDTEEFTQQFLSQFDSIEWQTIESLIDNGYRNREELMAFDLKEDLPLLPNVSMAQKSLLRKALQLLMSDEELERKVNDIKSDNVVEVNKRKRKGIEASVAAKRSRNIDSLMSDNDEMFVSQLSVEQRNALSSIRSPDPRKALARHSARKSIASPQIQTRQQFETINSANTYVKEVPTLFKFENVRANKRYTINGNAVSNVTDEDDDEDYEEIEEEEEVVKRSSQRLSAGGSLTRYGFDKTTIKSEPIDSERRRSSRSSLVSPTTTSKAKYNRPANNIPTPTELELREHLEKKKSMGKTRRARK